MFEVEKELFKYDIFDMISQETVEEIKEKFFLEVHPFASVSHEPMTCLPGIIDIPNFPEIVEFKMKLQGDEYSWICPTKIAVLGNEVWLEGKTLDLYVNDPSIILGSVKEVYKQLQVLLKIFLKSQEQVYTSYKSNYKDYYEYITTNNTSNLDNNIQTIAQNFKIYDSSPDFYKYGITTNYTSGLLYSDNTSGLS